PPDPTALLTRLWTELLGHDGLVGHSDFFELGGDSLLVTRLARRATKELGVQIPVRDLMTARSLSGQAELVTALTAAG
ncbi:acyl carrier protein, partial [Streptomyces sp. MBT65]|uniref:acyl carrier protein n=1 Tax=Streptomyces sp. MBT65 TaxID=1488395 RepID=UPI00190E44E0